MEPFVFNHEMLEGIAKSHRVVLFFEVHGNNNNNARAYVTKDRYSTYYTLVMAPDVSSRAMSTTHTRNDMYAMHTLCSLLKANDQFTMSLWAIPCNTSVKVAHQLYPVLDTTDVPTMFGYRDAPTAVRGATRTGTGTANGGSPKTTILYALRKLCS